MGAANRDPEQFPEPDRLDFDRPDNRHLAFGWAAHFCFGVNIARLEARIAFETLLRRFPSLQLTGEKLDSRENLGVRIYEHFRSCTKRADDHTNGALGGVRAAASSTASTSTL